jgi:hypothetical protein
MKRNTHKEWAARIDRWAASGLDAEAFAQREGVNINTLRNWKWQLATERRRRAAAEERAVTEAPQMAFVELAPVREEPSLPFEVSLRGGARIVVPPKFDPVALRELVSALGGC